MFEAKRGLAFKIKQSSFTHFYIWSSIVGYLHSDGSNYHSCPECWPTRELAQAVLDKYQLPHVWKHGDVFECHGDKMIFVARSTGPPVTMCFTFGYCEVRHPFSMFENNATFLFNIKDKL